MKGKSARKAAPEKAAQATPLSQQPARPLANNAVVKSIMPFFQSEWITSPVRLFVLLCAIAFLLVFLIAMLSPPVAWTYSVSEEPLSKLTAVQMRAGEEYFYLLRGDGIERPARIVTATGRNCGGLMMYDASYAQYGGSATPPSVCMGMDGAGIGADGKPNGNNFSYANISWPYFAPWMLAVKDGWEWRANSTVAVDSLGAGGTQGMLWKQIGSEKYLGRDGWLVSLSLTSPDSKDEELSRMLIDKEKRILLYSNSSGGQIFLVKAPFPLSNGTAN